MKLIDTHCHLTDERLTKQLEGVLERAEAAGVVAMVSATVDAADSVATCELAGRYEQVYCSAGVHPHEADRAGRDYLSRIEELAGHAKNVAIGEIGLDYHYDAPKDVQRRIFAEQLELAGRLGKSVIVHVRDTLDDTLAILAETNTPGERIVFHSFTGGPDETRRLLDIAAYVSYSGIATFKKEDAIRAAAALVPDDRILIETDAPGLSPEPVRKMQINEPANVAHVAACLADVRKTTPETFAEQTTANAIRFFGLDTLV